MTVQGYVDGAVPTFQEFNGMLYVRGSVCDTKRIDRDITVNYVFTTDMGNKYTYVHTWNIKASSAYMEAMRDFVNGKVIV